MEGDFASCPSFFKPENEPVETKEDQNVKKSATTKGKATSKKRL
jgi:hypothetical protein